MDIDVFGSEVKYNSNIYLFRHSVNFILYLTYMGSSKLTFHEMYLKISQHAHLYIEINTKNIHINLDQNEIKEE